MNTEEKFNWGDIDNESEGEEGKPTQNLDSNVQNDPKNLKFEVEYKMDQGHKVKVTKTIRVIKRVRRINKRVEERRKRWVKFGKCNGVVGPENGVTGQCEDIPFVLGEEERKATQKMAQEKRDEEEMKRMYATIVAPSNSAASTGVWKPTFRVQSQQTTGAASTATGTSATGTGKTPTTTGTAAGTAATAKPNTYVPPRLRMQNTEEDSSTIRVTNLSEDVTEEDLKTLFRRFGDISRTYLAKDKNTSKSKGFAFINFKNRSDAQKAMDTLNGTGWNYLILTIEWAKPSH